MRSFIMVMTFLSMAGFAQENNRGTIKIKKSASDTTVYTVVDYMAVFPGGDLKLYNFIRTNLIYPATAKENGKYGTVFLTFIVEKNGEIGNVKIIKDLPDCPECITEALRVVSKMPSFVPGKNAGVPVRVLFYLPIRFRLS